MRQELLHLFQPIKAIFHPVQIFRKKRQQVRETIKFYSQFIKKGNLCFDVGANIGEHTETFLRLGAKVIAIEPQIENIRIMQEKFRENKNVILVHKGIAEKGGQRELMVCNYSDCSTMSKDWLSVVLQSGRLPSDKCKWESTQTVDVTTLDSLVEQYGIPDFCKIDVEGFEYNVLRGLSQAINALSFEFTPEILHPTIKCVRHLNDLGKAEFNYTVGKSLNLSLPQWVSAKEVSHILLNTSFKTCVGPGGDVYARFFN